MNTLAEVAIYDPNSTNPYGEELSALLARAGLRVTHWSVRRYEPESPRLRVRPLPGGVRRKRAAARAGSIVERIVAPVRAAFGTTLNAPLISVWTADAWDAFMLLARIAGGGRVICILHNPVEIRPRSGVGGRAERALMRRAEVVVHSAALASAARHSLPCVSVVRHPPYAELTSGHERWTTPSGARCGRPRVAFVGALRRDKGISDLPAIARASGGGWMLSVLGSGHLPDSIAAELAAARVSVAYGGGDEELTDERLIGGILDCTVVIAPYRQVTESGSMQLAAALGAPVLAYDSAAARRLVGTAPLSSGAIELGRHLRSFLDAPETTADFDVAREAQLCSQEWLALLGGAASARCRGICHPQRIRHAPAEKTSR